MARDRRQELDERAESAVPSAATVQPEPAHDPQIVAQAMREGVPVAQEEQQAAMAADPVFSARVNVMDEYNAALEAARQPQGISGPVTRDVILEATATLQRYQTGKANLEARIVDNEEYFRLMHNGLERANRVGGYDSLRYRRNTAWLFISRTTIRRRRSCPGNGATRRRQNSSPPSSLQYWSATATGKSTVTPPSIR